jgi:hypothetical protein
MDLAGPITIVVAGELAGRVTDGVMDLAPSRQPSVDVIFIRVNYSNLGNHLSDQGPDRRLLDILQHPDDDLAGALEHAEDRRFLLLQCAPSRCLLQPATTGGTAVFLTASGWPLCPATT